MTTTPVDHPLETLYQAREVIQAAISAAQQQTPEQISDDLACYAAVDMSIVQEFRALAAVLADKTRTSGSPTVRLSHARLCEIVAMFDQIINYVERHRADIEALRSRSLR
ncbi:hypothetical protein [Saccharopolyspora oryzae]|uniref:Uncharacterized protein n=1 Tax=Saccharopolyspora oryzae TaxID=2997343 RepID=A0ABT4V6Q8_9PSEU|nr:hypothetical protein [Saccharopolyspora oryzae]MDA3629635.1 hypothetical protein [Saccharopolyspora oryzae]